ncbi:MAG: hypothetical protein LN575_02930 [Rickettsia endosymbiont of Gnoriste bilineata]|nr:hypothetical protein [Rickettsia endosymbiont of Gnoriste bilineata]
MFKQLTKLIVVVLWINTTTAYAEDNPTKVNEDEMNKTIRIPANPINFPLFKEDKKDIDRLIKKFNNKKKREIVFSISSREPLKKWRPDLTQTIRDTPRVNCFSQIPNTPCINPDYIPIGIRMPEDDEYFYVRKNETSPVRRYKKTLRQKMESKIKCIYY